MSRPAKSAARIAVEAALVEVERMERELRKRNEARAVLRETMRDLSKLANRVSKQPQMRVARRRRVKRS